jgi:hypothetical protein
MPTMTFHSQDADLFSPAFDPTVSDSALGAKLDEWLSHPAYLDPHHRHHALCVSRVNVGFEALYGSAPVDDVSSFDTITVLTGKPDETKHADADVLFNGQPFQQGE